ELFGGTVDAHTRSLLPRANPRVTESWIEITELARTNAVPTAPPTATAMTDVRRGSRSRLARASDVVAPARPRARRAARTTTGAIDPDARRNPSAATPAPTSLAIGCHRANPPFRWPAHAAPSPA